MSARLRKQIAVEREQLHQLIETHRRLLTKCREAAPDAVELSALAAMLHAFYTGVENILIRVAVALDGGRPRGEVWHRRLLDRMAAPGDARPSVVSADLRAKLRGYLDFRHLFRHAYTFQLQWPKMSSLVANCDDTLRQLEAELDAFLDGLDGR